MSKVPDRTRKLPAALPLCYKPYMRKWMRDRLKRRKKPQETKPAEAGQAPLQPAYFDSNEPSHDEAPASEPEQAIEAESAQPSEARDASEESGTAETAQPAASGNTAPKRRRRGRGGRGRGRKAPGRAPVAVPSTEPSAPAIEPSEAAAVPAVATPAEVIPVAPPRPAKGGVILAIGLPGSGKSSWFKRNNINPLSSDMLRMLLFDDAQEQRFQDLVFSNLRSMLKARLIARRPLNYVDATNLTPHDRQSWIKLAKDYGYEVQAVFFDVPVEVCIERNRRRERVVDEEIMRKMAAKLKPPTFEEGFSKVTVVRVKKKEAEAS
jgi:predicted kinase